MYLEETSRKERSALPFLVNDRPEECKETERNARERTADRFASCRPV